MSGAPSDLHSASKDTQVHQEVGEDTHQCQEEVGGAGQHAGIKKD